MFNRGTIIGSVLIGAVLVVAGVAQAPPPASNENSALDGRYRLFSGEHAVTVKGGGFSEKVILRIDTVTGRTYRWVEGQTSDGKPVSFWSQIGD